MSFKEFSPAIKQGKNSLSPTLGKYLERESIPYWSPQTRGEINTNREEYNSIDGIVASNSGSQLAPSATEFIPGVSSGLNEGTHNGSGSFRMQSVNGLNLSAAAWAPLTIAGMSSKGMCI